MVILYMLLILIKYLLLGRLRDLRSLRSLRHSSCYCKPRVSLELQEAILAPSRRLERTPCKALRGEGPSAFVLQEASLMPSAREGAPRLEIAIPLRGNLFVRRNDEYTLYSVDVLLFI